MLGIIVFFNVTKIKEEIHLFALEWLRISKFCQQTQIQIEANNFQIILKLNCRMISEYYAYEFEAQNLTKKLQVKEYIDNIDKKLFFQFLFYDQERKRENLKLSFDIQENSQFHTDQIFKLIAQKEDLQIQIHHSVFPDLNPRIIWTQITRVSNFFTNIWCLLEYVDYYHVIQMDYPSSRLIKMESRQLNYEQYFINRRSWELQNLDKFSFNGIIPHFWALERAQTIGNLRGRQIAQSTDWDSAASQKKSNQTFSNSLNSISTPFKNIESQTLSNSRCSLNSLNMELESNSQFKTPSQYQCSRIQKLGETSSLINEVVLKDSGILDLYFIEQESVKFICLTKTLGQLTLGMELLDKVYFVRLLEVPNWLYSLALIQQPEEQLQVYKRQTQNSISSKKNLGVKKGRQSKIEKPPKKK